MISRQESPDELPGFWLAWTDEKVEGNYTAFGHNFWPHVVTDEHEFWALGEPEAIPAQAQLEDCVFYQKSIAGIADAPCTDSRNFVCLLYVDDFKENN